MKNVVMVAIALVLLLGSMAHGAWYVGPTVGYAYYPAPVYAYPAPVPYATYYAPMPAGPVVVPAPAAVAAPVPVVVGRPVVVGPAGKVYIAGRPVRNAVRFILP